MHNSAGNEQIPTRALGRTDCMHGTSLYRHEETSRQLFRCAWFDVAVVMRADIATRTPARRRESRTRLSRLRFVRVANRSGQLQRRHVQRVRQSADHVSPGSNRRSPSGKCLVPLVADLHRQFAEGPSSCTTCPCHSAYTAHGAPFRHEGIYAMSKKTFAVICAVAALHFAICQTDVLASQEPPPASWMATDIGEVGQPSALLG